MASRRALAKLNIAAILFTQFYTSSLLSYSEALHVVTSPHDIESVEANNTECSDGVDNDNDGKVDALVTSTGGGGDFSIESADPKYGKTWVASITCRNSGGTVTLGGGNPGTVVSLVASAISNNNLPFSTPQQAFVRSDGDSGGGNVWTSDGTEHTETLEAICTILGYDDYVSSTCLDNERSGTYPNGKCNFHSPGNNLHTRFNGTILLPQCNDGIDNDNDGQTDTADGGCDSANDTSELEHDPQCVSPADDTEEDFECSDGIDNDNDGQIDALDESGGGTGQATVFSNVPWAGPGTVNAEINARGLNIPLVPQRDSIRRDGATMQKICEIFGYGTVASSSCVLPGDGRCNYTSPGDNVHQIWNGSAFVTVGASGGQWLTSLTCSNPLSACNDGIDNDNDGQVDLADSGCESANDTSEIQHDTNCDSPTDTERDFECSDGIDNDNDGFTDWPNDFSCSSPTDDDEENPKADCQDGIDNDNDGRIDGNDPGCSNSQDDDEFNQPEADVQIVFTGTTSVALGGDITYTAAVTNNGPDTATSVTVSNPIPTGFTFNSGASSNDCGQIGNSVICDNTTLTSGQSDNFQIVYTVTGATCGSSINNTASVSTAVTDPNGTNNTSTASTTTITCTQCQDGIDNDGDGTTDLNDPGCSGPTDDTETDPNVECDDGVDNDNDGDVDFPDDPGCMNSTDDDETDPECSDGLDNDGDGFFDHPNDPGCFSPADDSELNSNVECDDGVDNDNDNRTDFPDDPGCADPTDDDESEPVVTQCNDGIDNDGDGTTDFPNDPGCSSALDDSEKNPNGPECDNGVDDDNDNRTDFPNDPGCSGPSDDDESEPECSDGIDNDNNGLIDFPADPGCTSALDDDEDGFDPVCNDGIDNDNDGFTDFPLDPGCTSPTDNSERNPNGAE